MTPLIDTLAHIHEDTGEPEALGMLRTMKTYKFVATLMMLSDVLPVLTCLSRALQAKTADFTLVASHLTYVQHFLQQIKERPNDQEYLSTVLDTVTDLGIGVVEWRQQEKIPTRMCCSLTWKRSTGKSAVASKIPWASLLLSAFSIHRNVQQISSNCTNMALLNWRSS